MINGRYYSATLTSGSVAYSDLMDQAKTAVGSDDIVARKLTLISGSSITIQVNDGVDSSLWENSDGNFILSLDKGDAVVSRLAVKETSVPNIFLAIVY